MDLDDIKRGLRAEIKKRENEQYFTFQCNVRQMCKDVLAKLEEQESEIAEKDKLIAYAQALVLEDIKLIRHQKYKRCLAMARWCGESLRLMRTYEVTDDVTDDYWNLETDHDAEYFREKGDFYEKWKLRWLILAKKFKEAK